MNFPYSVRGLWVQATLLLASGLASCSRGPELSAAAPASAPMRASVLAPAPGPAPKPALAASSRASSPLEVSSPPAQPVATAPAPIAAPTSATAVAAAPAATYTQAGRVLDESGQPLVGATVLLRGSTRGTSTDASGSYLLEVPKGENTFVIGYAGYENETASSHDGQPLTVTLLPAPSASPGAPAKGRRGRR